jgi:predicted sugar kinase
MTEEEFNETEQQAKQRKESVRAAINALHNETRDLVIEEVAQHVEKLTGFGQDTVSSLAIYIREMKK